MHTYMDVHTHTCKRESLISRNWIAAWWELAATWKSVGQVSKLETAGQNLMSVS